MEHEPKTKSQPVRKEAGAAAGKPRPQTALWPLRDVLHVTRVRWQNEYVSNGEPGTWQGQTQRWVHELLQHHTTARLYPYVKGIDLTNDGIGYGEEVAVTVASASGGQLRLQQWVSRRTRSGSQPVENQRGQATPEAMAAPYAPSIASEEE